MPTDRNAIVTYARIARWVYPISYIHDAMRMRAINTIIPTLNYLVARDNQI
jgi:hypothetical protein